MHYNTAINKKGREIMEQLKVMLCCGAGISSGLMAQQTRKAAKKKGLNMSVEARSESEVTEYYQYLSILLLGPHYASQLDEFQSQAKPYNLPVAVIPKEVYGSLDGAALVDFIMKTLEEHK